MKVVNIVRARYIAAIRTHFTVPAPVAVRAFDWLLMLIGVEALTGTKTLPEKMRDATGLPCMLVSAHPGESERGCVVCDATIGASRAIPDDWMLGSMPERLVPLNVRPLNPRFLICPTCAPKWPERVQLVAIASVGAAGAVPDDE